MRARKPSHDTVSFATVRKHRHIVDMPPVAASHIPDPVYEYWDNARDRFANSCWLALPVAQSHRDERASKFHASIDSALNSASILHAYRPNQATYLQFPNRLLIFRDEYAGEGHSAYCLLHIPRQHEASTLYLVEAIAFYAVYKMIHLHQAIFDTGDRSLKSVTCITLVSHGQTEFSIHVTYKQLQFTTDVLIL